MDIAALKAEIVECHTVQRWAPNSVRTRYVDELEDLLGAIESGEGEATIQALEARAEEQMYELASEVAHNLAQLDSVKDALWARRCWDFDAEQAAEWRGIASMEGLVAFVSKHEFFFDDSLNGHRDGFSITPKEAVAYASCRSWKPDDCAWVEVDLISGEVSLH